MPTNEENVASLEAEEVNTKLQLALISNERLSTQLGSAHEEIAVQSDLITKLRQQISQLQIEADDRKKKIEISESHKTMFASSAKESQIEKLINEHSSLEQENKKLKKYIITSKSRHEAITSELSQKLEAVQLEVQKQAKDSHVSQSYKEDSEFMIKHLRDQVKSAQSQIISWRELAEASRRDQVSTTELKTLAKSLQANARELELLTNAIVQIQNGQDPELSAFLSSSDDPPETYANNGEVIESFKKTEVQLGKNCAILRDMICENYADSLCNKSGCISQ